MVQIYVPKYLDHDVGIDHTDHTDHLSEACKYMEARMFVRQGCYSPCKFLTNFGGNVAHKNELLERKKTHTLAAP